ncbi:MAG: hypothetical protein IT379_06555 [Deltaproteobacteria bacterium]|nr:hypothetical protein [Deltaproteobacteria bacterium]
MLDVLHRSARSIELVVLVALVAATPVGGALAQATPTARATRATVTVSRVGGTLRADAVRQLAGQSWATVSGCVSRSGARAERVTVRIAVPPPAAGRNAQIVSVRAPRAASACVREEIARWQLPADAGAGTATIAFRTSGADAQIAGAVSGAPIAADVLRAGGGVIDAGQGLLGGPAPLDPGATGGGILQAPAQVGQAVVGALTGQRPPPAATPATPPPSRVRHTVTIRVRGTAGVLTRTEATRALSRGRAALTTCIDERLPAGGRGERRVQLAVAQGRVTQWIGAQGGDEVASCVQQWLTGTTFTSRPEPTAIEVSAAYRPRGAARPAAR